MKRMHVMMVVMMVMICGVSMGQSATFDDLSLGAGSYWNGADGSGGFVSGGASFNNTFTDWGYGATSWGGFAYSNRTDATLSGLGGQYTSIPGGAQSGSQYAVGYYDTYGQTTPTMTLGTASTVSGLYVSNDCYTYYTMLNGDAAFGVQAFTTGSWFELIIRGTDASGAAVGSVVVPLADFRDGKSEILNTWRWVDLSGLGVVSGLEFTMASSDVGDYGINTPTYFVIDTVVVPEPMTMGLVLAGAGLCVRRMRTNRQ